MPLKFRCRCGSEIAVPNHYAGRLLRCPLCKQRSTIPAAAAGGAELSTSVPPSQQASGPQPPLAAAISGPAKLHVAASPSAAEVAVREAPPSPGPSELQPIDYLPDRGKRSTANWLASGFVVVTLAGMLPALLELRQYQAHEWFELLPRWCLVVFAVAFVQLAYAAYFVQLPDWSSTWVMTLVSTLAATGYAVFLGQALLAPEQSLLIEPLDLSGRLGNWTVTSWCCIMLCLTGLWSYSCGRFSIRWYTVEQHR